MTTTLQTKLAFQVAHTCPMCGQVAPELVIQQSPEVIIRGKPQEIINISTISGRKARRRYMRQVPVICVIARDE